MPEEAEKVARKQLERLKGMQPSSARVHRRAHVPRVARRAAVGDLDARTTSTSPRSARCLDEDHYGLEKVKKRILEYMAVRKLKNDKKGPILCLVGPPGVGKTSLGRSVARAIGRKFVPRSRSAACATRPRSAATGAPTSARCRAASSRASRRPGPTTRCSCSTRSTSSATTSAATRRAALLEVLDPEQNSTFSDHYLEVPFDLSKVMFIATANQLDPIPRPCATAWRSSSCPATRARRSR